MERASLSGHESQDVLESDDGVDPLLGVRRTGRLRDDDALVDGTLDVDEARQNLLYTSAK